MILCVLSSAEIYKRLGQTRSRLHMTMIASHGLVQSYLRSDSISWTKPENVQNLKNLTKLEGDPDTWHAMSARL
jgi:hypothetical protein